METKIAIKTASVSELHIFVDGKAQLVNDFNYFNWA